MNDRQALVVVVDNVPAIVEELLTLMELHDVPGVGASDLDEAIACLEAGPAIRAVSCDIRLDRESGLDIIDRVDRHPDLRARGLRYLFVTGDKVQSDHLAAASGHAVLSKPVRPDLLIQTIQGMLGRAEQT